MHVAWYCAWRGVARHGVAWRGAAAWRAVLALLVKAIKPLAIEVEQVGCCIRVLLVVHIDIRCPQPALCAVLTIDDANVFQGNHIIADPQGPIERG